MRVKPFVSLVYPFVCGEVKFYTGVWDNLGLCNNFCTVTNVGLWPRVFYVSYSESAGFKEASNFSLTH
jgi:hypothetical protein